MESFQQLRLVLYTWRIFKQAILLETQLTLRSEVTIHGADNGPPLLLRFRGTQCYYPLKIVRQFGWSKIIKPMMSYANSSSSDEQLKSILSPMLFRLF